MQILLFYFIVVQSCVLCDVESTLTPTESNIGNKKSVSEETVGRGWRGTMDGSGTKNTFSHLEKFIKKFFSIDNSVLNSPSSAIYLPMEHRMGKILENLRYRLRRKFTNQYAGISDTKLNRKRNNRVLRAIDERNRLFKKNVNPRFYDLDNTTDFGGAASTYTIPYPRTVKYDFNKDNIDIHLLPEGKTWKKNSETMIRKKRYFDHVIFDVNTHNKRKPNKMIGNVTIKNNKLYISKD